MRMPEGHVVEAELSKGGVKVHLQPGSRPCERGGNIRVIGSCAYILSIVTTCFFPRRIQRNIESCCVEDRRGGVRHGEHNGESTCERGRCSGIKILFMDRAGFAQMDVWVDQAGKF